MKVSRLIVGALLALLGVLAALLAWSWAPDRSVDSLAARWAPSPSQFVDVQGMRVHVRDEGPRDDPEPIVLLHGTSASLHTWDGWVGALAPQRRVIRFDMPGFGLTGPQPQHDYRLSMYTQFVVAMLDHLKVQRVVLGGNSLGGEVAWQTAAAHPERVSRLILVDAAGYPTQAQSVPLGFRLAQIPALQPVLSKVTPREVVAASVRNVYGDPSRVTSDLVDRYFELTLRAGNRQALGVRFAQASRGREAAKIADLRQPTLIVWGGQDRLIPPDQAQQFHDDIAGSQLVVFEDLGHVPHEEDPLATVAVVKAFLTQ